MRCNRENDEGVTERLIGNSIWKARQEKAVNRTLTAASTRPEGPNLRGVGDQR